MSDDFSDVVTADVIGSCDVLTIQFTLNPDEMRRVLIASGLPQLVRDTQRELAVWRQLALEAVNPDNPPQVQDFHKDQIRRRVDALLAANA